MAALVYKVQLAQRQTRTEGIGYFPWRDLIGGAPNQSRGHMYVLQIIAEIDTAGAACHSYEPNSA